jgi:hypothetical protein
MQADSNRWHFSAPLADINPSAADVWQSAGESGEPDPALLGSVRGQVAALCKRCPVYGG